MWACSLEFIFLLRSTEASINDPDFTLTGCLASGDLQLIKANKMRLSR